MYVDGVWGGSVLLFKKYRGLMKGIDRLGIKEIMLTMYLCYIYGTFIVYIYYIIFICNKEVKNYFNY